MATTLFLFSGCTERIVYVDSGCPKLQTWGVKAPAPIHVEVKTIKDDDE
jgi:hypothetical protein